MHIAKRNQRSDAKGLELHFINGAPLFHVMNDNIIAQMGLATAVDIGETSLLIPFVMVMLFHVLGTPGGEEFVIKNVLLGDWGITLRVVCCV